MRNKEQQIFRCKFLCVLLEWGDMKGTACQAVVNRCHFPDHHRAQCAAGISFGVITPSSTWWCSSNSREKSSLTPVNAGVCLRFAFLLELIGLSRFPSGLLQVFGWCGGRLAVRTGNSFVELTRRAVKLFYSRWAYAIFRRDGQCLPYELV
jgi:hypothetical protein